MKMKDLFPESLGQKCECALYKGQNMVYEVSSIEKKTQRERKQTSESLGL